MFASRLLVSPDLVARLAGALCQASTDGYTEADIYRIAQLGGPRPAGAGEATGVWLSRSPSLITPATWPAERRDTAGQRGSVRDAVLATAEQQAGAPVGRTAAPGVREVHARYIRLLTPRYLATAICHALSARTATRSKPLAAGCHLATRSYDDQALRSSYALTPRG